MWKQTNYFVYNVQQLSYSLESLWLNDHMWEAVSDALLCHLQHLKQKCFVGKKITLNIFPWNASIYIFCFHYLFSFIHILYSRASLAISSNNSLCDDASYDEEVINVMFCRNAVQKSFLIIYNWMRYACDQIWVAFLVHFQQIYIIYKYKFPAVLLPVNNACPLIVNGNEYNLSCVATMKYTQDRWL